MKNIISLFLLVSTLQAAEVPVPLLKAIHQVETSGRFGAIKGDNGAALGPFQIHKAYWIDATQHDKSIGGSYSNCADYAYSVKIVNAYMSRYAKKYLDANNSEAIARIHNGGLNGYKNTNTLGYWNKVKKNL